MSPRYADEAQPHQHVLADDNPSDWPVDQTCITHGQSETHHQCLVCNGIDECSQVTSLIEVTSNIPVAKVENTSKGKC